LVFSSVIFRSTENNWFFLPSFSDLRKTIGFFFRYFQIPEDNWFFPPLFSDLRKTIGFFFRHFQIYGRQLVFSSIIFRFPEDNWFFPTSFSDLRKTIGFFFRHFQISGKQLVFSSVIFRSSGRQLVFSSGIFGFLKKIDNFRKEIILFLAYNPLIKLFFPSYNSIINSPNNVFAHANHLRVNLDASSL